MNVNTNSYCSLQTLLLCTKYPILLQLKNLWTDSDRKWGLESESKSKIERKHLHHIDISNLVNVNTNSHCSLQTLLLCTKYINCNKIGYFVHRRRVCKEQWELELTFTKLDISIWCRCFLSIFDFYSDSRPHFRSESVQRFSNCNKIGYFVHRRRLYFVIVN